MYEDVVSCFHFLCFFVLVCMRMSVSCWARVEQHGFCLTHWSVCVFFVCMAIFFSPGSLHTTSSRAHTKHTHHPPNTHPGFPVSFLGRTGSSLVPRGGAEGMRHPQANVRSCLNTCMLFRQERSKVMQVYTMHAQGSERVMKTNCVMVVLMQ